CRWRLCCPGRLVAARTGHAGRRQRNYCRSRYADRRDGFAHQYGVSGNGNRKGADSCRANTSQLVQENVGGLSGRRREAARQYDRTATGMVRGARKRENRPGKGQKALTHATLQSSIVAVTGTWSEGRLAPR